MGGKRRLSYFYDDELYDYHNKIALKYPGIVGFRGHQDHAYWQPAEDCDDCHNEHQAEQLTVVPHSQRASPRT